VVSILLNATLTHDGNGYVRRLTLQFVGDRKRPVIETACLSPGMTREEVAECLRAFADQIMLPPRLKPVAVK